MIAIAVNEGHDSNGGGKEGVTGDEALKVASLTAQYDVMTLSRPSISFWFFSITVILSLRCFISK